MVIAIRDIAKGEEITVDYSLTDWGENAMVRYLVSVLTISVLPSLRNHHKESTVYFVFFIKIESNSVFQGAGCRGTALHSAFVASLTENEHCY